MNLADQGDDGMESLSGGCGWLVEEFKDRQSAACVEPPHPLLVRDHAPLKLDLSQLAIGEDCMAVGREEGDPALDIEDQNLTHTKTSSLNA